MAYTLVGASWISNFRAVFDQIIFVCAEATALTPCNVHPLQCPFSCEKKSNMTKTIRSSFTTVPLPAFTIRQTLTQRCVRSAKPAKCASTPGLRPWYRRALTTCWRLDEHSTRNGCVHSKHIQPCRRFAMSVPTEII